MERRPGTDKKLDPYQASTGIQPNLPSNPIRHGKNSTKMKMMRTEIIAIVVGISLFMTNNENPPPLPTVG
jgi:hypothetical protein